VSNGAAFMTAGFDFDDIQALEVPDASNA